MPFRDEELVGEAKVQGATWRVTRVAGMFRIWTDATDPRYVISADIPCEVFEAMARDVASRSRGENLATQLGADIELRDVDTSAAKGSGSTSREQVVQEAIDEIDYP
jgi:hypothetical protein